MKFEKTVFCPLCGRDDTQRSFFGALELHDKEKAVSGLDTLSYDTCKCGLIFHNYMMTDETVRKFYQDEYRATRPTSEDDQISASNISEETHRAKLILQHLNNRIDNVERCLDIGCSTGKLLALLKDRYGCETVGVEMNKVFRKQATADVVVEDLEEVEGKFDLITLIHVLEHCTRPLEMLAKISELLEDGGYLVVEVPVPKATSDGGVAYGFNLAHPIAFVSITLFRMLTKAGYKLIHEMKGRHLTVIAQ
jgi:cyclopropane fatty-acyl-phospholipid synthase-like methyltransferase